MHIKQIKRVVILGLMFAFSFAYALEADVGRATIILQGDNWQEIANDKQEGNVSGGNGSGILEIKQKTWLLTDGSKNVKAILLVRGTSGGYASEYGVSFRAGCKKNDSPYAYTKDDTGGSSTQLDCLRAFHIPQSAGLINQMYKVEQEFAKNKGLNLPKKGTFVNNMVSMSSGTFLFVSIFADEDWSGVPSAAIDGIPATIKSEVVAWANEMSKAARSSVRSFSGKMVMPPIEFKQ
jgi:hypothetical protein